MQLVSCRALTQGEPFQVGQRPGGLLNLRSLKSSVALGDKPRNEIGAAIKMSSPQTNHFEVREQPPASSNGSRRPPQADAETNPVASDPEGWNSRVSQLRTVEQARGEDAALSVALGEAVVTVEAQEGSDNSDA